MPRIRKSGEQWILFAPLDCNPADLWRGGAYNMAGAGKAIDKHLMSEAAPKDSEAVVHGVTYDVGF